MAIQKGEEKEIANQRRDRSKVNQSEKGGKQKKPIINEQGIKPTNQRRDKPLVS
jgi:hypothetical protein